MSIKFMWVSVEFTIKSTNLPPAEKLTTPPHSSIRPLLVMRISHNYILEIIF